MGWTLLTDVDTYRAEAGTFLHSDPVAHTVALSAISADTGAPRDPGALFAVQRLGGAVTAVCWRTPPFGVGVTATAAVPELAALLVARRPDVRAAPMVVGPAATAAALAAALTGRPPVALRSETLYRLDTPGDLTADPRPAPPGRLRPVTSTDMPILVPWLQAFNAEAGTVPHPDPVARLRTGCWVWDDGGRARAFAGGRATGAGVARIGPVYSPPEHRGAGTATALVSALCQVLLADVDTVTLYADDANSTSTGIYRRMGFRPVLSWGEYALG